MAKVTINDIATAAGVSKATVSYVLNRRSSGFQISDETAIRVLQCCQKLNYRPDEAAVRLSECRKAPLRLLVASPWLYAQFSDFMVQINLALRQDARDTQLAVTYASYSAGELRELLRASVLKRYDALIISGTSEKDNEYLAKHAAELGKVVLLNRQVEGILSCSGNDAEAMKTMVSRIDLSAYARCAAILPSRRSISEMLRCKSFIDSCAGKGKKTELIETDNVNRASEIVLPRWKKEGTPMLVFVPQNIPAALLFKELQKAEIAVPEKIGIIAYDRHSLLDQFIEPPLTTVDPRLFQMATEAIEMCCALREHKEQSSRIVKAEIIMGNTTVNL